MKKPKRKQIAAKTRGKVRKEEAEFPVPPIRSSMPANYTNLLANLKSRIQQEELVHE